MPAGDAKGVAYVTLPMAASTEFLAGAPVCYDTSGRAATPANTSGFVYAGTALQDVDNDPGSAGDLNIPVLPPGPDNRYLALTISGVVQADCGEEAYFTGATTASKTTGNGVKAGTIIAVLGTNLALVDTMRHVA